MVKKKQDTFGVKTILIVIGIIIGVFILFIVLSDNQNTNNPNSLTSNQNKNCHQVETPYEDQESYLKTEYYTESVPYTDQECESKDLVYKKDTGICSNWEDNWLSDNTPAKYSCVITNLDTEGGTFSLEIGFNVGSEQLKETQSKYIYPQSSETFDVERDSAIDSCFCRESSIPTKQVCRDVIKYRDVQKERQVYDNKPVTKYKTETVCD